MAQKRFINFQDGVSSFPLNERYNGILPAGRYCGFDTLQNISGLTFDIGHTGNGATKTLLDESVINDVGEWLTNQGTSIHESSPIVGLSILANTGVNNQRIDILVGEHFHDVLVQGGLVAAYHIVTGPNNGAIPAVTIPASQTLLAYIYVPANAPDASGITITPTVIPGLGGQHDALLDKLNRFTDEQQFIQGPNVELNYQVLNGTSRGILRDFAAGNIYKVSTLSGRLDFIDPRPKGTIIAFYFEHSQDVYLSSAYAIDGENAGYFAIKMEGLPNGQNNITLADKSVLVLQVVEQNDDTFWKVLSRSDTIGSIESLISQLSNHTSRIVALEAAVLKVGKVQATTLRYFAGDPTGLFDSTGLGIVGSDWEGWALCNGQNNTPDYRQTFLAGLDPFAAGFQFGQTGGVNQYQLTQQQMPVYDLILRYWTLNFPRGNTGSSHNWVTGLGNQTSADGNITDSNFSNGGAGAFVDNRPKYAAVGLAIKL